MYRMTMNFANLNEEQNWSHPENYTYPNNETNRTKYLKNLTKNNKCAV